MLSGSRFALAALWIAVFAAGVTARSVYVAMVAIASFSDFVDGRLARRLGVSSAAGRWLDSLADIAFVLAALCCESFAGAIPLYIPVLIAISFTQYAIDSTVIHREGAPVRSRLGHWGGVINYGLAIALAIAPPASAVAHGIRAIAPLLAAFYLAAIAERVLAYR